ncbi:site-2 protease family protein [Caviibacter abscessus]|uniref:site-2 protease family protein n=1 Tax=Caviibacter abscessus TaxID=1766719 RepID=UPI000829727E|nr:site-2 protease family protein [Caviibacter abscessus]
MKKIRRLFYEIEYFDAKYPYFKYIILTILLIYVFRGSKFTETLITIIVLIISVILHEISHGYVAYLFGDDTAKRAGRLSLNPLNHVDLAGLLLPVTLIILRSPIIIGSAKPVPVNYYALSRKKYAVFFVSIAGILCNLLLAILGFILFKNITFIQGTFFGEILIAFTIQNLVLVAFNLLPLPPLDGSKILLQFIPKLYGKIYYFLESNTIISFILLYLVLRYTDIFDRIYYFLLYLII